MPVLIFVVCWTALAFLGGAAFGQWVTERDEREDAEAWRRWRDQRRALRRACGPPPLP